MNHRRAKKLRHAQFEQMQWRFLRHDECAMPKRPPKRPAVTKEDLDTICQQRVDRILSRCKPSDSRSLPGPHFASDLATPSPVDCGGDVAISAELARLFFPAASPATFDSTCLTSPADTSTLHSTTGASLRLSSVERLFKGSTASTTPRAPASLPKSSRSPRSVRLRVSHGSVGVPSELFQPEVNDVAQPVAHHALHTTAAALLHKALAEVYTPVSPIDNETVLSGLSGAEISTVLGHAFGRDQPNSPANLGSAPLDTEDRVAVGTLQPDQAKASPPQAPALGCPGLHHQTADRPVFFTSLAQPESETNVKCEASSPSRPAEPTTAFGMYCQALQRTRPSPPSQPQPTTQLQTPVGRDLTIAVPTSPVRPQATPATTAMDGSSRTALAKHAGSSAICAPTSVQPQPNSAPARREFRVSNYPTGDSEQLLHQYRQRDNFGRWFVRPARWNTLKRVQEQAESLAGNVDKLTMPELQLQLESRQQEEAALAVRQEQIDSILPQLLIAQRFTAWLRENECEREPAWVERLEATRVPGLGPPMPGSQDQSQFSPLSEVFNPDDPWGSDSEEPDVQEVLAATCPSATIEQKGEQREATRAEAAVEEEEEEEAAVLAATFRPMTIEQGRETEETTVEEEPKVLAATMTVSAEGPAGVLAAAAAAGLEVTSARNEMEEEQEQQEQTSGNSPKTQATADG